MREPTYLDSYRGPSTATAERGNLLGKVFGLLAFSMAFTAVGAFVGVQLPPAVASSVEPVPSPSHRCDLAASHRWPEGCTAEFEGYRKPPHRKTNKSSWSSPRIGS